MIDNKTTDRLLNLAAHCKEAIYKAIGELAPLEYKISTLTGHTCSGKVHWRDKNANGTSRKLIILHRNGQSCPIHGTPRTASRLRVYIGNKPGKIEEAKKAIEQHRQLLALNSDLRGLLLRLERAKRCLQEFYCSLNYTIPPKETPVTDKMVTSPPAMATGSEHTRHHPVATQNGDRAVPPAQRLSHHQEK